MAVLLLIEGDGFFREDSLQKKIPASAVENDDFEPCLTGRVTAQSLSTS